MAKPIENNDNAKEFLENLASASALSEVTKAAFRGVIGAGPLFRSEIPYNRANAAVVIAGALTSDGSTPIATPVTLEPDGDLYWSGIDGELTDNADGTFYLNIYPGIWTGMGATVEEAVWTPASTETGDPIATPQITAGAPGQGCIVDDGVNPKRVFVNAAAVAGDPAWVEITVLATLLAADNDWTGVQVYGGGFTVNGSAVFGPLATFTYIGSEAAHRTALAGGSASTGTGGLVRATSPTLTTPTLGAATATSMAMAAGSAALPSYTFGGDLNTGAWSPAADTWAVSTGGTERMRIGSTGMVGIGTASPAFALDLRYDDNAFARGLALRNTNTGTFSITGMSLYAPNGTLIGGVDYFPTNYANSGLANVLSFTTLGTTAKLAFITGADQATGTAADIYFQNGISDPIMTIKGDGTVQVNRGSVTFPSNAGGWNGATITGAQAFSGNVTVTGTTTLGGGTAIAKIRHGNATLVAGTVTVTDTAITANSRIHVNRFADGGTLGDSYSITRSAGASFTISSYTANAAQTSDTSIVTYLIIEP